MLTLKLTDDSEVIEYDLLEVPLTESPIRGATDIETLDGNVSTYFTYNKRSWRHRWAYMSKEDYEKLKGFYDRQFTNHKYPLLSIPELNVNNVPVLMNINQRDIVNNCGMVSGVETTFRESKQLGP